MPDKNLLKLFDAIVSDIPFDKDTKKYKDFEELLPKLSGQATYVYSLKEKRLLFCHGWEDLLGYKDEEMSMRKITDLTVDRYHGHSNEINRKALFFILKQKKNLEEYSFTMALLKKHKSGKEVPLLMRVGVSKAEDGEIIEIMGMAIYTKSLKFGKVMQYATYGPKKSKFEETLSQEIFQNFVISSKEKEALLLAANGKTFKEIAVILNISKSAVEKRIHPLYKRFSITGLPNLVKFAYSNNIL